MQNNKRISIISRMGGKFQLIDHLVPLVMQTALEYNLKEYAELCGGGARVLINLPVNYFEKRIYNEINKGVCNIFQVLQNKAETAELMMLLEKYRYSKEVFKMACEELEIDRVRQHLSTVERATYTYIAIAQSRAATTQAYSPSNEYDMGYYEKISKLKEYYYLLENVEIQNQDCMILLDEYKEREDMLIYLDPPYIPITLKSPKTYGKDSWSMEQHQLLVAKLLKTKAKVIVSGYEDDKFYTYKSLEDTGWTKIKLKNVHIASAVNGRKKDEYVWCNFVVKPYTLQKISIQ